jgi:acyl dehydratase
VAFHLLHARCGSRLQTRRECPIHGVVPREETVKGYEFAKDEYVRFEPEELKALERVSSSALVIAVGQTFRSGRRSIDKERIKTFATEGEFDPQPFHLDEQAARSTIFGGLAASGWHTAAVTMRLLVESELKPTGGIVGAGFDEFRWPQPVRPSDALRIEAEVVEVRPSRSRSDQGVIKVRATTFNQNGEAAQVTLGPSWSRAARSPRGQNCLSMVGWHKFGRRPIWDPGGRRRDEQAAST